MAFKPSQRRTMKVESTELDLRPIMNMMCILIPLLLSCSQFVKQSFIALNLPPITSSSGASANPNEKPPEELKVGLKLIITEKGMTLAGNLGILSGASGSGPTLPKTSDGKYDFDGLDKKMKSIIKSITGKGFTDERQVVITAEDAVEYQVVVTAMDVLTLAGEKKFKDQASGLEVREPWFANIGVGKLIL